MEHLFTTENAVSLLTLTLLEIVLGVDNVIFISILAGKLPKHQQKQARQIGLFLAMFVRSGLLLSISWIMSLKANLFTILDKGFSGRDLILLVGGLFLIAKTVTEIYEKTEASESEGLNRNVSGFASAIVQIVLIDIVFSFDSILTAVGLSNQVYIMIAAVVISIAIMMFLATAISDFIDRHPSIKILALSFLVLIGVLLVAEGFGQHVEKGYVYFAMAFALGVEALNIRIRRKDGDVPVKLRNMDEIS